MKAKKKLYHYLLHYLKQTILNCLHEYHNQPIFKVVLKITLYLYKFIVL